MTNNDMTAIWPRYNDMTKEQQEDLLVEWGLYEPRAQQAIIVEYNFRIGKGDDLQLQLR